MGQRTCPTCGAPCDWRKAYCSERCRPECSFGGCKKPTRGRDDVCAPHQAQRRLGRQLSPLRWSQDYVCVVCGAVVESGTGRRKHCSNVCQMQDSRHKGNRPEAVCVLCGCKVEARTKSGRFKRTDSLFCDACDRTSPAANRFKRYGVRPAEYAAALARGCDICHEVVNTLHIDHDHSCCPASRYRTCHECVRGFLCGNCNRAIGIFKDDVGRIRSALDYLTKHRAVV